MHIRLEKGVAELRNLRDEGVEAEKRTFRYLPFVDGVGWSIKGAIQAKASSTQLQIRFPQTE